MTGRRGALNGLWESFCREESFTRQRDKCDPTMATGRGSDVGGTGHLRRKESNFLVRNGGLPRERGRGEDWGVISSHWRGEEKSSSCDGGGILLIKKEEGNFHQDAGNSCPLKDFSPEEEGGECFEEEGGGAAGKEAASEEKAHPHIASLTKSHPRIFRENAGTAARDKEKTTYAFVWKGGQNRDRVIKFKHCQCVREIHPQIKKGDPHSTSKTNKSFESEGRGQ